MNKIDFVVTWVDGSDPEWLAEKRKYSDTIDETLDINGDARYRDMGLFQYWFRAVEKNAPWVNKIFLITCGHLPDWLDVNHPKLVIVNHKDFIPEEYLPTFNSITIELNIHRIKELSEHFVLFNDDVFLTNTVLPTDFFVDGLPKAFGIYKKFSASSIFSHILLNNTIVMNRHFKKSSIFGKHFLNYRYGRANVFNLMSLFWKEIIGYSNYHVALPLLKSTFEVVWSAEEKVLHETSKHQFRNFDNVNIFLMNYWNIETKQFVPQSRNYGRAYTAYDLKNIKMALFNKKFKVICINDSEKVTDVEKVTAQIKQWLDKKYPEKSAFERRD